MQRISSEKSINMSKYTLTNSSFKFSKSTDCIPLCKGEDFITQGSGICNETGNPFDFMIVFDGHGDLTIQFMYTIKKMPLVEILQNIGCPAKAIQKILIENYKNIPIKAGSTFTCVKIFEDRIIVTSVGDSTAQVYKNDVLVYSSPDHNMQNLSEVLRLRRDGIQYYSKKDHSIRVISPSSIEIDNSIFRYTFKKDNNNLHLAMTQSLGHHNITGLEPAVKIIHFGAEEKIDVIIASDGLWDVFNSNFEQDRAMILNASAREIAKEAEKRWKQEWDLIQGKNIYKSQIFPADQYDDVAVGIWRRRPISEREELSTILDEIVEYIISKERRDDITRQDFATG
jgi:serine/threonine protein phosphatase PrpC